jgi:hypothetical protein
MVINAKLNIAYFSINLTPLFYHREGREFESRQGNNFSLLHIVQTGSDHSPPTSAEVKKMCTYTSTPSYVFMA